MYYAPLCLEHKRHSNLAGLKIPASSPTLTSESRGLNFNVTKPIVTWFKNMGLQEKSYNLFFCFIHFFLHINIINITLTTKTDFVNILKCYWELSSDEPHLN